MENNKTPYDYLQKFLTRKNIFMVLGAVITVEVIWAALSLVKSPAPTNETIKLTVVKAPTISLLSSKTSLKVGEKVTVDINFSSGKKVDGADILINYDPKILSAQPVIKGTIFPDFPVSKVDEKSGRITVSGITDQRGGVLANGLFGSVEFSAKAAGTARISLEFTPLSTADSNLTESGTGKDILEKVSDLEVTILP